LIHSLFFLCPGTTDSELLFALFLNQMSKTDPRFSPDGPAVPWRAMVRALECVFEDLAEVVAAKVPAGEAGPSLLNVCVTDGVSVVATRHTLNGSQEAYASLYYASANYIDVGEVPWLWLGFFLGILDFF
jgi:glutamine amidotransferase